MKAEEDESPEIDATPTPKEATPSAGAAAAAGGGDDADDDDDDDDVADEKPTGVASRAKIDGWLEKVDKRDHLNVVFIGHVDAGKSTLSGQMLFLTGSVDERTIEKFSREAKQRNRESWFLAFIMDTSEEERAKGKTVEVGRAEFGTDARRYTILDAPGHKNYVPNMIQGASQADVGVLVISARKGEFEAGFDRSGQTREHALLAKTLGVRLLIVVINKMDEETVQWSQERFDDIKDKLEPFLKRSGYNTKKHVHWVPISAITGANVQEKVSSDVCPWYKGKSLFETMNTLKVGGRDPYGPLRVPVLDRYNDRGVVAMGKVESGMLVKGRKVMLLPVVKIATVDEIRIGEGEDDIVDAARPGDNIYAKLKGISDEDLHKGFMIVDPGHPAPSAKRFQAQLQIMDLEHRNVFTAGYNAVLHLHTAEEECTVDKLVGLYKKDGTMEKNPRFIKSNQACLCNITLTQNTPMEKFETFQQLGRFTLRDEGRTIAIGKITGIPKGAYDEVEELTKKYSK